MDDDQPIAMIAACAQVCEQTIMHCLEAGGDHADPAHIALLMDCASICSLNTTFLLRESEFSEEVMELCAEVCDTCADSCDELEGEEMERCAKACRECAEACRA